MDHIRTIEILYIEYYAARYILQISSKYTVLHVETPTFFAGGGDGLGTPAIAGAVVGVMILLVIVILVIVFLLLRRRKVS